MTLTRVVLADDHTLVRAGVRKLLESLDTIEVVGEAGDGLVLLALVEQLQPDVVLMDITMPELNGLEATLHIARHWPQTRVLILSMYENEEYVSRALGNGAVGYLLKDAAPAELHKAIQTVLAGRVYLSPAVSQEVIGAYVHQLRGEHPAPSGLSPRQREVLQLVAQGHSTKEIARLLGLSGKTVETHRSRLMQQLGIHEVTALVRYAMRIGLVRADQ
jgi:DNA-binding NarL/FixJ family response regulator